MNVSKKELRWVLGFGLVVMSITMLPYLVGYAVQGDGWRFTGFVFGVDDGNSYIAKMLAGAHGAWLFRTPYSASSQNGVVAFLPYLILGKLTGGPAQHEQLVVLFHIYRFAAGLMAIYATYRFLACFIDQIPLRRWGVAIASLGGGLGWLLVLIGKDSWLGSLPLDFYSPESFGFLSLYGLPHLSLARALLLLGLVEFLSSPLPEKAQSERKVPRSWTNLLRWVFRWEDKPERRLILRTGGLWVIMSFAQPLTVITGWGVLGAYILMYGLYVRWRKLEWSDWLWMARRAMGVILVSSPMVVYTAIAFVSEPFLRAWTAQNIILSPHPLHYLVAYGLLIPLSIVGAYHLVDQTPRSGWLSVAWVAVFPLLAYAPHNLQRRLPDGVWVALVTLTLVGFQKLFMQQDKFRRWAFLPFVFAFPTTLLLLVGGIFTVRQPGSPLFRPVDEVATFDQLAAEAQAGEVVLAAFETGNGLPAWAPVRVVIGHGPESVNLAELRPQVVSFFDLGTTDLDRKAFLTSQNVAYVFWGPAERELGTWKPDMAAYLEQIIQVGNYSVFRLADSLD